MNRWLLAIMLLLTVLLAGCQGAPNAAPRVIQAAKPAAGAVDDLTRLGQSVIGNHGDELAANASKIRLNPNLQKVDDFSETVTQFKRDVLSTKKAADSAEDVARAQADIYNSIMNTLPDSGVPAPRVIYNTPASEWTASQFAIYDEIRSALGLDEEDAKLFLAGTCHVFEFIQQTASAPSREYVMLSIMLEEMNNQPQSKIEDYVEFADDVTVFADAFLKANGDATMQDAAKLGFDGLCLVAD